MQLSVLRKLTFGVHDAQKVFFRLAKKIRSTGWILKPKLDNIMAKNNILLTRCARS